MNDIKERKQLTYVNLKDWRVLISERSPKDIAIEIANNTHIMIEWELHSKFDIINAILVAIDDVEWFILSQTKDIQRKLREKKIWLQKEQWKEMTISYAKNYVDILSSKIKNENTSE